MINLISKPDLYENDNDGDGRCFYTDGPKIHQFLKEMNEETFGKDAEVMTVGEMSSTTIDHCIKYSSPVEKELSMVFSFHHLKVDYKDGEKWSLADFDFRQLKEILSSWQYGMQEGNGWNALSRCNHDRRGSYPGLGMIKSIIRNLPRCWQQPFICLGEPLIFIKGRK